LTTTFKVLIPCAIIIRLSDQFTIGKLFFVAARDEFAFRLLLILILTIWQFPDHWFQSLFLIFLDSKFLIQTFYTAFLNSKFTLSMISQCC